jgi:RHS repeat-associated protein
MNHEGPWYATIGPINGYQYNGKELNEELDLDWNDYGARWQDPATGRWWQVDPLGEDFKTHSVYNYALNNPILLIDPDGMRVSIVGDKEYRTKVFNALINLALSSGAGAELVNMAFSSESTLVIGNTISEIENQLDEWNTEERGYATLAFDLDQATADLDAGNGRNGKTLTQTVETSLAHELAHFLSPQTGYLLDKNGYRSEIAAEEVHAVEMENRVRKEMGLPERTHYGGRNVYGKEAVESKQYPGYYTLRNKTNYAPTGSKAHLNTPLNHSEVQLPDYKFTPMIVLRGALKRPLPQTAWIIFKK